MSAGAFVNTFYETDLGTIVPIKLQPETLTASFDGTANAAGGTTAEPGYPSAQVSKSKRAIGINARTVSIKIDTPATGYLDNTLVRIPVLDLTVFNGITKFSPATCAAGSGQVVGKSPESVV